MRAAWHWFKEASGLAHQGDDPARYPDLSDAPLDVLDYHGLDAIDVGRGPVKTRVVVVSDTHERHAELSLPAGDVLIHCGDFTNFYAGSGAVAAFDAWLGQQPFATRIVVCGNHETSLKHLGPAQLAQRISNAHAVLQDSSHVTPTGLRVYGAPWTPARSFVYRANAFSLDTDAMRDRMQKVTPCDVLVTHVPPLGTLDETAHGNWGCVHVRRAVERVAPRLHVYGHVHDVYNSGVARRGPTVFSNAAQELRWRPQVFDVFHDPPLQ